MTNCADIIVNLIKPKSSVLDLGCGTGSLLQRLRKERDTEVRGIELNSVAVQACINRGIPVFQGDLNDGLQEYINDQYDYIVISKTIQEVRHPAKLLKEALDFSKNVIVTLPNFGYIGNRLQFLLRGRMPVTRHIPSLWYNTPNIHFCTRLDFLDFCSSLGGEILYEYALNKNHPIPCLIANLFALESIFMLRSSRIASRDSLA